jgi:hypothetical protein
MWMVMAMGRGRAVCLASAILLIAFHDSRIGAANWLPVDPAELALKTGRIDPTADAEALLWDVRLTDSETTDDLMLILEHYVRIKVFTERGRDAHGKVDLTYTDDERVRDVEGRTISPTGTITELRGQDVFDRTIVKTDGLKLKAKSFVMPAVVPGSIIEYRWREIRDNALANDLELPFQRDIPTHLVRYHLKPLPVRDLGFQMQFQFYNMRERPQVANEERGYTRLEMRDVPALDDEPLMPPALAVKPWMLVYYADLADVNRPEDRFWTEFAKDTYGAFKPQMRSSNEIRAAVAAATKTATTPADKVAALVQFVRQQIKRSDVEGASARERNAKDNKTVADVLKRGVGTGADVTLLLTTMAQEAGLEARLVLLPDRGDFLSQPGMRMPYFLQHLATAVRLPEGWMFFDAADPFSSAGRLPWRHEGMWAVILDDKKPEVTAAPITLPDGSLRIRNATFTLAENGTLSGTVTHEYTGHAAAQLRAADAGEAVADRQRAFSESIAKRLPGSEVSNVAIENFDDPELPYVVKYALTVPNYAQRTGSRLFVQPAVLQRGIDALFSSASRTYAIYFPYPYREQDTITIELPAGYDVEPDAAQGGFALAVNAGYYKGELAVDNTRRRATFTRQFFIGGQGRIIFQTADYSAVKKFFDDVHKSDGRTLTLRRTAAE